MFDYNLRPAQARCTRKVKRGKRMWEETEEEEEARGYQSSVLWCRRPLSLSLFPYTQRSQILVSLFLAFRGRSL